MRREVAPEQLDAVLAELSYPAIRPDAAAELREVILVLEDRELNLGGVISDAGEDAFRDPEELRATLQDAVPEL